MDLININIMLGELANMFPTLAKSIIYSNIGILNVVFEILHDDNFCQALQGNAGLNDVSPFFCRGVKITMKVSV